MEVTIYGLPRPQGSKKGFVANGRAIVVDDNKPQLRTWREDVKHATRDHLDQTGAAMLLGPVQVTVLFAMPRPKHHYRTGRNAHLLRDNAPQHPATKPDVDKLLRSTLDALKSAGAYKDDAQVAVVIARKAFVDVCPIDAPGALIRLEEAA